MTIRASGGEGDTNDTVVEILQRAFDSPDYPRFLVEMADSVCISARGAYVGAETNPAESYAHLAASNELIIVISNQLKQALGADAAGYPSDAFLKVLRERSEVLGDTLAWSVRRASKLAKI